MNYEDIDNNYLKMVRKKLPHNKFIELLGLDIGDFGEDEYNEFISAASVREHFLFDHYYEFSDFFPSICILRRRTDTGAFAGGHSAALADIDFFCLSGYFSFNNDIVVLRYPFKHGVG